MNNVSKKDLIIGKIVFLLFFFVGEFFMCYGLIETAVGKISHMMQGNAQPVVAQKMPTKIQLPISEEAKAYEKNGEYQLVWVEDFQKGTGALQPVESGIVYNGEEQYYLPENVTTKDGQLHLTGKKEAHKDASYTSGKVHTKDTFSFQYGKVEIVAKSTATQGSFPAVWMLPTNGKVYPEINIFEQVGREANSYHVVNYWHDGTEQKNVGTFDGIDTSVFHTYTMEWTEESITWSVDGTKVFTSTEGVPQEEMYLIINLAIGGEWAGDVSENSFPMDFVVDSVSVWQK